MRRALLATMAGVAAILALAIPALATRTVRVPSTVSLAPTLSSGKVSSAKKACIDSRRVVVKFMDASGRVSLYGTATTDASGKYSAQNLGSVKGRPPFKFFAVAKARSEGTAGTVFVCRQATSKIRVITGG